MTRAPWVTHFGFTRTPFSKTIPAKDLLERASHQEAVARIRSRLFRDIDARCKDCNERQKQFLSLEPLAEWESWALMRDAADRLLALAPSSEHALFHTMYVPMCNYAVFQHNLCKRIAFAHQIFAWLRRHAESDQSACELLSKNMKASQGWT